mgnify:CR=1 FL=1
MLVESSDPSNEIEYEMENESHYTSVAIGACLFFYTMHAEEA